LIYFDQCKLRQRDRRRLLLFFIAKAVERH
jgi:hypothetical protein